MSSTSHLRRDRRPSRLAAPRRLEIRIRTRELPRLAEGHDSCHGAVWLGFPPELSCTLPRRDRIDPVTDPFTAIEARGLVKHFDEVRAIDHLDLRVEGSSIHGLVGP